MTANVGHSLLSMNTVVVLVDHSSKEPKPEEILSLELAYLCAILNMQGLWEL